MNEGKRPSPEGEVDITKWLDETFGEKKRNQLGSEGQFSSGRKDEADFDKETKNPEAA